MALALAPHGIRVNAIAPGITDTAQPRYQFSEAEMVEQSRLVPLGNMASPADIADVVVFLASRDARFMTGATVHANGRLCMAREVMPRSAPGPGKAGQDPPAPTLTRRPTASDCCRGNSGGKWGNC